MDNVDSLAETYRPGVLTSLLESLLDGFSENHVLARLQRLIPFYQTSFWHPTARIAGNIFEAVIDHLRDHVDLSSGVSGVE